MKQVYKIFLALALLVGGLYQPPAEAGGRAARNLGGKRKVEVNSTKRQKKLQTTTLRGLRMVKSSANPENNALRKQNQSQAREFFRHFRKKAGKIWARDLAPSTRLALQRFNQRSAVQGRSVKNLDLRDMSFAKMDRLLKSRGFKKVVGAIFDPASKGPLLRDGQAVRQVFYLHRDGGMVRVKPEGHPGSMRSAPHVSKSVRNPPNAPHTDFRFEAFKVDNFGNAIPKSPGEMLLPKTKQASILADTWAAAAHSYLLDQ